MIRAWAWRAQGRWGGARGAGPDSGQTSIAFTSGRLGARRPGRDEAVLQTIRELVLPSAWRGKLARFVPVNPHAPALEDLERQAMDRVGKECSAVEWASSYAIVGPCDYLNMCRAKDIEIASNVFANQIEDFALNPGGSLCTRFANETSRGRCLGR
jgi:hypothetical protein